MEWKTGIVGGGGGEGGKGERGGEGEREGEGRGRGEGQAGLKSVWNSGTVIIIYRQCPLEIIIKPFYYHPCVCVTQRGAPRPFVLIKLLLN